MWAASSCPRSCPRSRRCSGYPSAVAPYSRFCGGAQDCSGFLYILGHAGMSKDSCQSAVTACHYAVQRVVLAAIHSIQSATMQQQGE